jgi:putative addiction module component (TIGR02574 family)
LDFIDGEHNLMNSLDQVLQAALALSEEDRVQLVDTLIATLEPEDAGPLNETWLAEIQRRSRQLADGSVQPIPWEEVKERARRRSSPHG